jgi:putative transposase
MIIWRRRRGAGTAAPMEPDTRIQLNEYGKIVEKYWYEIPAHFPQIELGKFMVMPNHIRGILILNDSQEVRCAEPRRELQREQFSKPVTGSIPTHHSVI